MDPNERCFYGKEPIIVTSWKPANPGRRFYGYPNYEVTRAYGYFKWYGPPMCSRSVSIISGLLRSINRLQIDQEQRI